MTAGYVFTPEAAEDVLSIWRYIADVDTESSADWVVQRIYAECERLAGMPGMGHYREDLLDKRFKFWNAFSYLIVYRWEPRPIQVVSVVHGARDLNAFFGRRPPA